jgi:hypothetical protein
MPGLYEKLELMANVGATLGELEIEIDRSRPRTETRREEAWLYAWACIKYQERELLTARNGESYGDAGAG